MKKIIVLNFVVVVICLFLSGCSLRSVSEKQIRKDILKNDTIINCFKSKYVNDSQYDIKEHKIIKEQLKKDEKRDTVFFDFNIENDYFSITLSTECIYNYYDKGGWILDECNIINQETIPIKSPEGNLVINDIIKDIADPHYPDETSIFCTYNGEEKVLRHGKCIFQDGKLVDNNTAHINICYESKVLKMYGYYTLCFNSNDGWEIDYEDKDSKKIYLIGEKYNCDYTSSIGTFLTKKPNNMNVSDYNLSIKKITEDTIEYSIKLNNLININTYEYKDKEIISCKFDPISGTAYLKSGKYSLYGYEINDTLGAFIYNCNTDSWDSYYGPNYPSTYSDNMFFTPRQLVRK